MATGIVLLLVALIHTTNIKMLNTGVDAGWFGLLLAAVGFWSQYTAAS